MNSRALVIAALPRSPHYKNSSFDLHNKKSLDSWGGLYTLVITALRRLRQDDWVQGRPRLYTKMGVGVERKSVEDFESRNNSLTYNLKGSCLLCKGARAEQGDHREVISLTWWKTVSNSCVIPSLSLAISIAESTCRPLSAVLTALCPFCQLLGEVSVSKVHILQRRSLRSETVTYSRFYSKSPRDLMINAGKSVAGEEPYYYW